MTRISRTSLIAITFAAAGFALLGQGASARTVDNGKYCAQLENRDSTACRELRERQRKLRVALMKDDDGGGGGKGGRGGRGGQK